MVAVPYSKGQDRWTANELHALNKNLDQINKNVEELKNRMDLDRLIAILDEMKNRIATPLEEIKGKLSDN